MKHTQPKKYITSALLAGMLLMSGCSDADSTSLKESTAAIAETTAAASQSTGPETSSEAAPPKYDYVHGTDGYYCLTDELEHFTMPIQYSGTCWLYAASASMRSAYEKQTGKQLELDIPELLESIYGSGKQEGIFLQNGLDMDAVGGCQGFVTERLSGLCKNGITLENSLMIDPNDREAVKNAVKTRGGVAACICDKNVKQDMFGNYQTVNYTDPEEYDHDVTVIGWDDNFPKEYFKVPAAEDGAWITYNSNFSGGYYYISYCSPINYTVSHMVSDEYSEVLSYDAGNEIDACIRTGDSTKAANVFHRKGTLAAVGTYNDFDTQDIKIEIMSADFKEVLYTQDAKLSCRGYHTVRLNEPVEVEDCAVAVTYSKGAPVEGESADTVAGSYKTVIEKGQSFVFADGKWKDMSDSSIRSAVETFKGGSLFFNEKGAWKDFLTDSDLKALSDPDFEPGNCCIKALFVDRRRQ